MTGLQTRITNQLLARQAALRMGGLILGLFALSLAVGFLVGRGRTTLAMMVVALPALLFVLVVLASKFDKAVLALPLLALAVPIDLPTGTYSRVPVSLGLALALWGIWITSMIVRKRFVFAPSLLNLPSLLFCVICVLSHAWGLLWRDPVLLDQGNFEVVQTAALLTILVSVGAAILIGNFVRTTERLKFIVGAFLVCGALMTITQLFGISQGFLNDRGLWATWFVMPAYCLLIAQPKLRWYWRVLLLVLIMMNLYQTMVVNRLWMSGWIPTVIAIFVATFLRSKTWFLILLIAAGFLVYSQRELINEMTAEEMDAGSDERMGMWELNWRVVSAHWLFGTGPAGYVPYYMTYFPDDARSTHNNYLDIISQFGLSGTITWFWVAIAGAIEGLRQYRRAPPGFLRTLALASTSGWIAAQGAMFFGDWVLPFAYNQTITGYKYTVYSWIFLGMVISIRYILDRRQRAAETAIVRR